jgi:hypothetical protein
MTTKAGERRKEGGGMDILCKTYLEKLAVFKTELYMTKF